MKIINRIKKLLGFKTQEAAPDPVRCSVCGRPLKTRKSIQNGVGPKCAKKQAVLSNQGKGVISIAATEKDALPRLL